MTKDAFYFKHDANASSDLKIKTLRKHYGWEGYGWFWYLIEMLRNEEGYQLEYSEFTFDSLSEDMKCDSERVRQFIDDCIDKFSLLVKEGEYFSSPRLLRDMEKLDERREQQRVAGRHSAEARKRSFNGRSTKVEQREKKKSNDIKPVEGLEYD